MPTFEPVHKLSKLPYPLNGPTEQGIIKFLADRKVTARFVGGCVRDAIAGTYGGDVDIAVDVSPQKIKEIFEAEKFPVIDTGLKHGTVTLVLGHDTFEITTLRKDVVTDGRWAEVQFTDDWLEDASRRDFTFNAMYLDADGTLYDPFNGREDLKNGLIRFVGDPRKRIDEDFLRILRAYRFHARFGDRKMEFDRDTRVECIVAAASLRGLSAERVRTELFKLLSYDDPRETIKLLLEDKILEYWLPEARSHERVNYTIKREKQIGIETHYTRRLAALTYTYMEEVALEVAHRLKMSNDDKKRYVAASGPVPIFHKIREAEPAWRQYIYDYGSETFIDRLLIYHPVAIHLEPAIQYAFHWKIPEFPINGHDVLAMGVSGKDVKLHLDAVKTYWRDQDFLATRNHCLAYLAQRFGVYDAPEIPPASKS
jgi:poly(A) polymerase